MQSSKYTAKKGDTLFKIAKNHGLTLDQLLALNPRKKKNPDKLSIGESVNVPSLRQHTVSKGEWLSTIAEEYDTDLDTLLALNPHKKKNPDLINIGEKLQVPV